MKMREKGAEKFNRKPKSWTERAINVEKREKSQVIPQDRISAEL